LRIEIFSAEIEQILSRFVAASWQHMKGGRMEKQVGKFVNRLREYIKQSGYTLQEVAQLTNIPSRTLSDYCAGRTPIPYERLQAIAQLLGYPMDVLVPPLSRQERSQDIVLESDENSGRYFQLEKTNTLRREILQKTPSLVGTALIASSHAEFGLSLLDRLSQTLNKPSQLDLKTIHYLERQTAHYWQDRHGAIVASSILLDYVLHHLHKVVGLLEWSLLPSLRTQLCSIACKTCLLVGELFLDMSDFETARRYHETAIRTAQEANNAALESIAWGRLSLVWIYKKQPRQSLNCIQRARSFLSWNTPMANAWLAAIEAEVQADLRHSKEYLYALDEAEQIENFMTQDSDVYLVHFDRALLSGYQGACYRKLYCSEEKQSAIYLEKARSHLTQALDSLDASLLQRRPTFLTDLTDIAIQQKEVEEACERAIQALSVAVPIKLQKVLSRLLTLRQELEPWADTQYVKKLDEHLTLAFLPIE
jgi:transcriptional regulator with XRE-family HTH domain